MIMKDTLQETMNDVLEGTSLPSSVDGDLRRCSDKLRDADNDKEKINEVLAQYSKMRSRIKSSAGIDAAIAFDDYVKDLLS